MAEDGAPSRYCPICGERMNETFCKKDGVKTLDASRLGAFGDLPAGTVVSDRYRVERRLGEGAMGTVYEATQLAMDRSVALKVLSSVKTSPNELRRFHREAKSASQLKHPNIVSVYDFGVDEVRHVPFIAMELIEGRTLRSIIEAEAPFSPERAERLAEQIARGLVAAHRAGIIHRDLKPDNVMVSVLPDGEEHISVLDFGIAKHVELDAARLQKNLTASGVIVGTPRYMSPEQIEGRSAHAQADLYALGCVLFEMLTGRPPFVADDVVELMMRHVSGIRPPLPADDDAVEIPLGLRVLYERLVAIRAEDRPESASSVVRFLRSYRGVEGEAALTALLAREDPHPPRSLSGGGVAGGAPLTGRVGSGSGETDTHVRASGFDSNPPAPEGQRRYRGATVIALLMVTVALGGGAVLWPRAPAPDPAPSVPPSSKSTPAVPVATSSASAEPDLAEVTPPVPADPPEPEMPVISLSSRPPGAEVFEDGTRIGRTPMEWRPSALPLTIELRKRYFRSRKVELTGDQTELTVELRRRRPPPKANKIPLSDM